jgi:CheY-like chemotaxis protein
LVSNVELSAGDPRLCAALPPGEYVSLAVADTGIGMDEEVRRHIFEPFFTTKVRGTGLGLASVYGTVKQLGGHITVESAPGKGACFAVWLPRAAGPMPAIVERPKVPDARPKLHVLLVEDDDLVRRSIAPALESLGLHVQTARDGAEAIDVIVKSDPAIDVVVTDVVMPRMSGLQLAEELAKSHPRVRVLFVSGYNDDIVLRHGVESGAVEFLRKPYTADELASRIRALATAESRQASFQSPRV